MAKPIKKSLLIHNIVVVSNDDDGKGPNTVSIPINYVRFENTTKQVKNNAGEIVASAGMFFWDNTHSTQYDFKLNDVITFDGVEYTIIQIDDLIAYGLTHKEIYVN
jgi:hypothetical protein